MDVRCRRLRSREGGAMNRPVDEAYRIAETQLRNTIRKRVDRGSSWPTIERGSTTWMMVVDRFLYTLHEVMLADRNEALAKEGHLFDVGL